MRPQGKHERTREEIQEVPLQTAVYCGLPAALEAFRSAEKALDERESGSA